MSKIASDLTLDIDKKLINTITSLGEMAKKIKTATSLCELAKQNQTVYINDAILHQLKSDYQHDTDVIIRFIKCQKNISKNVEMISLFQSLYTRSLPFCLYEITEALLERSDFQPSYGSEVSRSIIKFLREEDSPLRSILQRDDIIDMLSPVSLKDIFVSFSRGGDLAKFKEMNELQPRLLAKVYDFGIQESLLSSFVKDYSYCNYLPGTKEIFRELLKSVNDESILIKLNNNFFRRNNYKEIVLKSCLEEEIQRRQPEPVQSSLANSLGNFLDQRLSPEGTSNNDNEPNDKEEFSQNASKGDFSSSVYSGLISK